MRGNPCSLRGRCLVQGRRAPSRAFPRAMWPRISFCETEDGARLAWASIGQGPLLVLPCPWVNHVQLMLEDPIPSAFFRSLARRHTVVVYDRRGTGLSDRRRTDFTLERDVKDLSC